MPQRFMLDTNTVSAIVSKRRPELRGQLRNVGIRELCVSVVTFAEVKFGLSKKPDATRVAEQTYAFFDEIEVLPWLIETADTYGELRARMERAGKALGALDFLIAAHALSVGATLVSNDQAFRMVPELQIEDWLQA
jgi:tRNA(fMet)-specific endonuclease VapC